LVDAPGRSRRHPDRRRAGGGSPRAVAGRDRARSRRRAPRWRGRAGDAALACHRGGHARIVVRGAPGRPPLEARVQCTGRHRRLMTRIVGIDLGTTTSALAHIDPERSARVVSDEIAQLVGPGELLPRPTLPSFLYLAGEHELPPESLALPWDGEGGRARDRIV